MEYQTDSRYLDCISPLIVLRSTQLACLITLYLTSVTLNGPADSWWWSHRSRRNSCVCSSCVRWCAKAHVTVLSMQRWACTYAWFVWIIAYSVLWCVSPLQSAFLGLTNPCFHYGGNWAQNDFTFVHGKFPWLLITPATLSIVKIRFWLLLWSLRVTNARYNILSLSQQLCCWDGDG